MGEWLQTLDKWVMTLVVLPIVALLLFPAFWRKWFGKYRQAAKENGLSAHLPGFLVIKNEKGKYPAILEGVFGVNRTEAVFINFENSSEDESAENVSLIIKQGLADIRGIELSEYDEEAFLRYARQIFNDEEEPLKYYVSTKFGIALREHIPKFIKTLRLCRFHLADGAEWHLYSKRKGLFGKVTTHHSKNKSGPELHFYYKDTPKNAEIMRQ
ncbi:MAG: hypothetical protein FWE85_01370, partial [Clostridiales bacterium]|nr:hypothetical protein [Clostridiales bacterium]